ncbi:MAG: Gfo/Idh/MocA family oxidoreductase, partial [Fimbriimonadales bacterium]|nr:Gfo/Idh/MocA family oxidoreductase [Fimbriimonadales bacterium]
VFLDLAIHDFDWLRWSLGEAAQVFSRSLKARSGQGPDYGLATLSMECGAVAHVEATWMDPSGFRTALEVCGSNGMIQHDSRLAPTLRIHREGGSSVAAPLAPTDDPYYKEIRAFLDAVQSGRQPPVSLADGFAACSIALAALESAQTDLPVRPARP